MKTFQETLSKEAFEGLSKLGHILPGRNSYTFLAQNYPDDLMNLIESGVLENYTLTFALEIAGYIKDSNKIAKVLCSFLNHKSLIVREGALLGLTNTVNSEAINDLKIFYQKETCKELKDLAKDIIDEFEEENK